MPEAMSARQFHHTEGVGQWRVGDGGASAWFGAASFADGVRFLRAVAAVPGVGDHPPDVDLRPDGVLVRLFTTDPAPDGLSALDVEVARGISAVAEDLGLTADPTRLGDVVLVVEALDVAAVLPFWRAVVGYGGRDDGPVEELVDPLRRGPVACFQSMDSPRPQRNRVHVDVWVPHDGAAGRVRAALDAGGHLVRDEMAPSWWVLADAEGNEACVATWIGTDGQGYP